jgi:hypothetical protein
MQTAAVLNRSRNGDTLTNTRMMQIVDLNVELLFLGSISQARAVSGKVGWLAPSASRHAERTSRYSISAPLACLPYWLWGVVMVVTPS